MAEAGPENEVKRLKLEVILKSLMIHPEHSMLSKCHLRKQEYAGAEIAEQIERPTLFGFGGHPTCPGNTAAAC